MVLRLLCCIALLLAPTGSTNKSEIDKGISLAVAAEYEEALKIFQKLLRDSPDDALLHYYAGVSCLRLNRLDTGITHLEKAVQRKAAFPQAYAWLAEAYLEKDRKEQALETVQSGLRRFPRNPQLLRLKEKPALK